MTLQVMLDLETMSIRPSAAIASIGAVKFTVDGGVEDEFYQTVDLRDCKKLGMHFMKSTVEWWQKQDAELLSEMKKAKTPLKEALRNFSVWYGTSSLPTWGNGAGFDNVIIENAYLTVGMVRPWKYWEDRCYRTVKNLIEVPFETPAMRHNALEDARAQANHLIQLLGS